LKTTNQSTSNEQIHRDSQFFVKQKQLDAKKSRDLNQKTMALDSATKSIHCSQASK